MASTSILLQEIIACEERGAISAIDAHSLKFQTKECATDGQREAVRKRLNEIAVSWNPYQNHLSKTGSNPPPKKRKAPTFEGPSDRKVKRSKCAGENFYQLLKIEFPERATPKDIKRQFHLLALLHHPDKKKRRGQAANNTSSDGCPVKEENEAYFRRLLVAYETLYDPVRRQWYDERLRHRKAPKLSAYESCGNQIQLEADTDFASLEWMARVKHKVDVMDRITIWAAMLSLTPTELRFETGKECIGEGCGKIVSMDRDLAISGSPRRRVYICLYHKYIHACDLTCTNEGTSCDDWTWKICPIRAFWIVQSWIYEKLQQKVLHVGPVQNVHAHNPKLEPGKNQREVADVETYLDPAAIHLGTGHMPFVIDSVKDCVMEKCKGGFTQLENGIFVCRRHGRAHICTFEQCDSQVLDSVEARYVCWISGVLYGHPSESVGTACRRREVLYAKQDGETGRVEMDVPLALPLGKAAAYLLGNEANDVWSSFVSKNDDNVADRYRVLTTSTTTHRRINHEQARARARTAADILPERNDGNDSQHQSRRYRYSASHYERLLAKVEKHEASDMFLVYVQLPQIIADLPKVALELQEISQRANNVTVSPSRSDYDNVQSIQENLALMLPLSMKPNDTVNSIKYWIEELSEQRISIWDQQMYWGDTLIGEEGHVLRLDEHGLRRGCVLELRLHDDCPLLVAESRRISHPRSNCAFDEQEEYNTVLISKEAEEDLMDELEQEVYDAFANQQDMNTDISIDSTMWGNTKDVPAIAIETVDMTSRDWITQ